MATGRPRTDTYTQTDWKESHFSSHEKREGSNTLPPADVQSLSALFPAAERAMESRVDSVSFAFCIETVLELVTVDNGIYFISHKN